MKKASLVKGRGTTEDGGDIGVYNPPDTLREPTVGAISKSPAGHRECPLQGQPNYPQHRRRDRRPRLSVLQATVNPL